MIRNVNEQCKIYEVGTEIYYTGDNANVPGYGVITEVLEPSQYSGGWKYNIKMNDGREMKMIYALLFGNKPGDRFTTRAEKKEVELNRLKALIKSSKTEFLEACVDSKEETEEILELIKQELEIRKSA